jgi:hypothetical protein
MLSSFPFSAYGKYSDLSTLEERNQQTPQIKSGQLELPLDLAEAAPNTLNSTDRASLLHRQATSLLNLKAWISAITTLWQASGLEGLTMQDDRTVTITT